MNQDFILKKIETLDTNQKNYVYFDWFLKLGDTLLEQQKRIGENDSSDSSMDETMDQSIRECLYLLDQRWNLEINLREFSYSEHMLTNLYYGHLATLPYRGVSYLLALHFKLKALLGSQRGHLIDFDSTYENGILDTWFMESCQLTALAKLFENKQEEICQETPLSTANTVPND